MDPDGTWHNLKPIAKLEVSGPDQEPRRYADTAFGGGWFAARTPAARTSAAGKPAGGTIDDPAGATTATGDPAADERARGETTEEVAGGAAPDRGAAGTRPEQLARDEQKQQAGTQPAGTEREQQATTQLEQQAGVHPQEPAGTELQQQAGAHPQQPTGTELRQQAGAQPQQQAASQPGYEAGARPEQTAAAPASVVDGPELAPHLPLSAADLSAIRWRLDGATLREVVDDRDALRELGERLDGPLADEADHIVKAGLLSVRAEVYRLLGELGMAAAASRLALAHAESAQDLQSIVIAQAELAHVLRLRGDFVEADRLFRRAVDADVPAAVRSVVHENAGRCCFDQGRHLEALDHFARAVRLGAPEDTDLVERIGVCLESVYIHVLRDGWGPYPRSNGEIQGVLTARGGQDALDEPTVERPVVTPR